MTNHVTCPLCRNRKGRRDCPALGQTICPVCCGTKRLVEIRCPSSCPYLSTARTHPAAVVQRRQDRDIGFFLPLVTDLTEAHAGLMLMLQQVINQHAASAIPSPNDDDVAAAAEAVAATLETSAKGVLYQHEPAGVPAMRLAAELRRAVAEISQSEGAASRLERHAAVVLRRIEQGARTAAKVLEGDEAPVYLGFLKRMAQAAGAENAGKSVEPEPRLIIPG